MGSEPVTAECCDAGSVTIDVNEYSDRLELEFPSSLVRDAVRKWFSADDPKAAFRARGRWQPKPVEFCEPKSGRSGIYVLAAGFASRLRDLARENGVDLKWRPRVRGQDPSIPFKQMLVDRDPEDPGPLNLDSIQIEACKALLDKGRCSIELGAGSGKSEVFLNAWACLRKARLTKRALIVVPNTALLEQTYKRIHSRSPWPEKVGRVAGGRFDPEAAIVVATIQSACGHENLRHSSDIQAWLPTVDLLIIDEVHHASNPQYQQLLKLCPATRVWGVSAKTTFASEQNRLKQLTLESIFGTPVYRGRSATRTCPTKVICYSCPDWDGVFDNQEIPADCEDMVECRFRRSPEDAWEEGYYRGPNQRGEIPEFCKQRDPADIWEYNPDGTPVYKESAMITRNTGRSGPERIYNPARMIPDRDKYGPYIRQPDGRWEQVIRYDQAVYATREYLAQTLFRPRNDWAMELAEIFQERHELFLITVKHVIHAERLTRSLRKKRVHVRILVGERDVEVKKAILEQMRDGQQDGIIATYQTISEGVDIPNLVHLIKLDGIVNEQTLTQQIGRVQRVSSEKRCGYLHFPMDTQHRALALKSEEMASYFDRLSTPVHRITVPSSV